MAWTNNGLLWYGGERPINRTPQLQATAAESARANPGAFQHTATVAYDPVETRKQQNSQAQIAVAYAQAHSIPITLTAAGDVREQPARQEEDARLTRALQGSAPRSQTQLNQWLKASDATLTVDQRAALTMQYEAAHGALPPVVEEDEQHKGMTFHPGRMAGAGAPTLEYFGFKKGDQLTEKEFTQRIATAGVVDTHVQTRLLVEARDAGIIVTPGQKRHTEDVQATRACEQVRRKCQANFDQLYRLQGRPQPAGGVRVSDMRASSSDWGC
jgi:hypothetical protein